MTRKTKKAKPRTGRIGRLQASVQDDLLALAEEKVGPESRWNRPRKQRISLRVDTEVVDWFKSKGSGYQTRINQILRRVMREGKKRAGRNSSRPLIEKGEIGRTVLATVESQVSKGALAHPAV